MKRIWRNNGKDKNGDYQRCDLCGRIYGTSNLVPGKFCGPRCRRLSEVLQLVIEMPATDLKFVGALITEYASFLGEWEKATQRERMDFLLKVMEKYGGER